jgi:LysR family transcriptional regulator for metE and metH
VIERTHLNILRQIEHDGSLTAAARSLHLTQSALSHAIRKLEAQAGTPIWRREGRRIRLTPAGRYLLAEAERLLPQFERIDATLADYADGRHGSLRIGMECHPCYCWLLKVVEPYLRGWPGVDIDVVQQLRFDGLAALCNHDIDILVTPDPLEREGVVFEPVFDYEQVLVVADTHPLAGRDYIRARDLWDQVLFAYPVDPERLDIYTRLLDPARCRPRKHKAVESTDIMLQLVAAKRGVAAWPRWLADAYADQMPITAIRLGREGIGKQIHLGVRQASRDEPPIAGFLSLAASTAYGQRPAQAVSA